MQASSHHLSSRFFALSSRNYLWAGAAALSIAGMALLSFTVMFKQPFQKLLLCGTAAGCFGAALATRHQYRMARDMFSVSEQAAMQGWAEQEIKAFAPIDQRMEEGRSDEGEEFTDDWAEETIAIEDEVVKRLLLSAGAYGIRCRLLGCESLEDCDRVYVELPTGVTVKKLQQLSVDIASKAGIDARLEISAVAGGVAIDLLKEVEYAEPIAPKVTVPDAEPVAVEADEETLAARKERSNLLPDGARLIELEMLSNIDRYPLVLAVAGQGSGKTATVNSIFSKIPGMKVISSPKPMSKKTQALADVIFGFNPETKQWLYFGDHRETNYDEKFDLTHHKSNGKLGGSVLDFLWACRRESMNRQLDDKHDRTPVRAFYDEANYCYSSGYNNPFDTSGKIEKATQAFISGVLKDALSNFRGQSVQLFIGAQSDTVDAIGLKGMAAARDECWFLYPGLSAITACDKYEKYQLKQWMQRRIKEGYGVALLVKEDSIFEVLNLPSLEVLTALSKD